MKNQSILYGIIGLLVGGLLTYFVVVSSQMKSNTTTMMQPSPSAAQMHQGNESMTMNQMMQGLQGKTGDDFDKTFMEEMIMHHQGAINMAKLAQQNAKHDEIKKMAGDIISAQNNEISEMKQWQQQWGYIK